MTGHLEGHIHVTVAIYDYADRQPDDGAEAAPAAAPEAAPLLASSPRKPRSLPLFRPRRPVPPARTTGIPDMTTQMTTEMTTMTTGIPAMTTGMTTMTIEKNFVLPPFSAAQLRTL